jgi:hypothetical protein
MLSNGLRSLLEGVMAQRILVVSAIVLLFATAVCAERGSMKISVFPAPPLLTAAVKFSEPSGNNILDAGEAGTLALTVRNDGKGDAFDVTAEIKPNKRLAGLSFEQTVVLGTIASGRAVTKEVALRTGEDLATDTLTFDIHLKEANGFDPTPLKISFRTKSFEPPKLVVADMGINDQNKNSRVEPMEIVEVTARIQNVGHGDARAVSVDVESGAHVFIAGEGKTHFDLGNLPSGTFKDVTFMFYTNNRIENGQKIPISLKISEARPRYASTQPLNLVMNAPQKRVEEIVVKGEEGERKPEIAMAGGLSIDVDINIPEGEKAGKYDIAVIIGNKTYRRPNIPAVEYADRDAAIMREYLVKTLGYDAHNIIYEENAGLSTFRHIFGSPGDSKGQLSQWVRPNVSRVFIYYVGHGAPDLQSQEAYFVPVDANPEYIRASGYPLQTFYENLAKIPAKNMTIILDACFSGNSEKGMLFKGISPAMVKVKKEYAGPQNATLISSGAMDQVSTWYPEKRHSLFTYYFLKGIQGDADANKDKKITVGEMKAYLNEHVPYAAQRLKGIDQQPVVMGKDDGIIAVLKK